MISQELHEKIVQHLSDVDYDGVDQATAFARFSGEWVSAVETDVPTPLTLTGVLGLLSQESLIRLSSSPSLTDIRDQITRQDRVGVGIWAYFLCSVGTIDQAELASINALLQSMATVSEETRHRAGIFTAFDKVASAPNAVTEEEFAAAWMEARG